MVDLDPRYYQFVNEFDERFANGVPSMLKCHGLTVNGDFIFGRDVIVQGDVQLKNGGEIQGVIADGTLLSG